MLKCYAGETGRYFKNRLYEHERDTKNETLIQQPCYYRLRLVTFLKSDPRFKKYAAFEPLYISFKYTVILKKKTVHY